MIAVHWKDKSDVYALSTIRGTEESKMRRSNGNDINKPEIILEYNKDVNGVDLCDQFLSLYLFNCKTLKWWKTVFLTLLELAVVNSMIILHDINPDLGHKYTSHKQFRQNLIHELIQPLLDAKSTENVYPSSRPKPIPMNDPQLKGNTFQKASTQQESAVQFVGIRGKPIANLASRKPLRFVK